MGVGLASFFSSASKHVTGALLAKHQQQQQQINQEISVLQSVFSNPSATAEQRALAVIGLDELKTKGKPGSGLSVFSRFATDPDLQARTNELVQAGQSLLQEVSTQDVRTVGGPAAGGPPIPGGAEEKASLQGPSPGAPPIDPSFMAGFQGPEAAVTQTPTGPASGGPPPPGEIGAPQQSELLGGGTPQLAAPALAGGAAQVVNRSGQQTVPQVLPPMAMQGGMSMPQPAAPAAGAQPQGGPPQPAGATGAAPASPAPAATGAQTAQGAPATSADLFAAERQRLEQQAMEIEAGMAVVQQDVQGFMTTLRSLGPPDAATGVFGITGNQIQKEYDRKYATEMLELSRKTLQQLETQKRAILDRIAILNRTEATTLASGERQQTSIEAQRQNAQIAATSRIKAAEVGADARADRAEAAERTRVLRDLANDRQRIRADLNKTLNSLPDADFPPSQRNEESRERRSELIRQARQRSNAAIADALGLMGADPAWGESALKASGNSLEVAKAKIRAQSPSPEDELWAMQSLYAAYLRTREGSVSSFDADYLLK